MKIEDIIIEDNLVPLIDADDLSKITKSIIDQYDKDYRSMEPWRKQYERALTIARMDSSKVEAAIEGGCRIMMPYLIEAAMDFNARVVSEVLSRDQLVFADISGDASDEDQKRAKRVESYAHKVLDDADWRCITDREMMAIPIIGTTYKKYWPNAATGKIDSAFIFPDKIIFSHDVQTIKDAPQIAEIMDIDRNFVVSMEHLGVWDIDSSKLDEEQTSFVFYEIQARIDIDEDGYAEPYLVTYCKDENKIVRIVANFDGEDIIVKDGEIVDIEPECYIIQKQILPDIEGKPMGMGFGILLSDIFDTININTRQLVDAGTLQNVGGASGLIASGVQPKGNQASRYDSGSISMKLGVFKQVQVAGGASLSQSVIQFPFSGPSPTLFQLMQHLEESARSMYLAGRGIEAQAGEAASMYLAKLGQAMKTPNAMIWRMCEGFKKEFEVIFDLIEGFGSDKDYQRYIGEEGLSLKVDFEDFDLKPTMNASQGSDLERVARAESLLLNASNDPQSHNMYEVRRRYYESLGVDDIDSVLPPPDPNAQDPLQQMQFAYMQMEAEFRNRELAVKEGDLAIKQIKTAQEMRLQVESMRIEAEKADADRVKTLTDAMKNLAEIADMEEQKALNTIAKMGSLNGRQLSDGNQGAGGLMAIGAGNAGVSPMS